MTWIIVAEFLQSKLYYSLIDATLLVLICFSEELVKVFLDELLYLWKIVYTRMCSLLSAELLMCILDVYY